MSQAFVKENDDNGLLHQIKPTIPALINYIKSENNNSSVYVQKILRIEGVDIVYVSNGFQYFVNPDNNWEMYLK